MEKKGDLSINIIIIAILALLVLVVIMAIFTGRLSIFSTQISDCESLSNGACVSSWQREIGPDGRELDKWVCPPEYADQGYIPDPSHYCYNVDANGKNVKSEEKCCIKAA